MAIILNNGVNLPDIPDGVLDERPYAVVCQSVADPTTYTLMVSSLEIFCVPASLTKYTCIAPWEDQMNYWYCQGTDSGWNNPKYTLPLAVAEYTVVWANHDVYNATAIESNTLIPGDIYFSKSKAVSYEESYFMPYEWFVSMADHARRLSGTSDKLTPEAISSTLDGVNLHGELADNERVYQVATVTTTISMNNVLEPSYSGSQSS